jgi:hypothetical protein
MARRSSSEEPDPFDDLFDDEEEIEDAELDIDDLRIADADDLDFDDEEVVGEAPPRSSRARRQQRSSSPRAPVSIGEIIGGLIQVILYAAIFAVIFLVIGFALVFAGQQLGLIEPREAGALSISSIALLATQPPVEQPTAEQPTAAPQAVDQPTAEVTPLPSATPDLGCPNASAWWNSQALQENYTYFTTRAVEEARTSDRLSALMEQMRIRRVSVADAPIDGCLTEARDALLRVFDELTAAARAANLSDQAGLEQHQANASQAVADLTAALWSVTVDTAPEVSPLSQGIPRGEPCGAQVWYDTVKARRAAFLEAAQQIDLNMTTAAATNMLNIMQAERGNVAAAEVPACATMPQQLLLGALDSYYQSIQDRFAGNDAAPEFAEYTRQDGLYRAWIKWLGLS